MLSICIRCRLQVVPFGKKVFFFEIRTKNFKTRDIGLLTFPAAAISHSFWLVKCDSMRLIIDIGISRSAPTSPFNFSASVDSIISFLHANQWSATWLMQINPNNTYMDCLSYTFFKSNHDTSGWTCLKMVPMLTTFFAEASEYGSTTIWSVMTQAAIKVNFKAVEAFFIVFRAIKSEALITFSFVEDSANQWKIVASL